MSRPSIWHQQQQQQQQHHPVSLSSTTTAAHNTSSLHTSSTSSSTAASNALQTRINAKRAELENLKQLRDLSAALASQMSVLEQKLSTLRDGTEAVAHVLANWDSVLNVIGMVGAGAANLIPGIDRPNDGPTTTGQDVQSLPETLVRIPVQEQSEKESNTAGV